MFCADDPNYEINIISLRSNKCWKQTSFNNIFKQGYQSDWFSLFNNCDRFIHIRIQDFYLEKSIHEFIWTGVISFSRLGELTELIWHLSMRTFNSEIYKHKHTTAIYAPHNSFRVLCFTSLRMWIYENIFRIRCAPKRVMYNLNGNG